MTEGHQRVSKALLLVKKALNPFIADRLKARYGNNWREHVSWGGGFVHDSLDAYAALKTLIDQWQPVFSALFKNHRTARTIVGAALDVRNEFAHDPESFDDFRTVSALGDLVRLLQLLPKSGELAAVKELWEEQRSPNPAGAQPVEKGGNVRRPRRRETKDMDVVPRSKQPNGQDVVVRLTGVRGTRRIYYESTLLTRNALRGMVAKEALSTLEGTAVDLRMSGARISLIPRSGSPACTVDGVRARTNRAVRVSLGDHIVTIGSCRLRLSAAESTSLD